MILMQPVGGYKLNRNNMDAEKKACCLHLPAVRLVVLQHAAAASSCVHSLSVLGTRFWVLVVDAAGQCKDGHGRHRGCPCKDSTEKEAVP